MGFAERDSGKCGKIRVDQIRQEELDINWNTEETYLTGGDPNFSTDSLGFNVSNRADRFWIFGVDSEADIGKQSADFINTENIIWVIIRSLWQRSVMEAGYLTFEQTLFHICSLAECLHRMTIKFYSASANIRALNRKHIGTHRRRRMPVTLWCADIGW